MTPASLRALGLSQISASSGRHSEKVKTMEALKTSVVAGHWERMDEEEGVDGSETPIVSWQVIVV